MLKESKLECMKQASGKSKTGLYLTYKKHVSHSMTKYEMNLLRHFMCIVLEFL